MRAAAATDVKLNRNEQERARAKIQVGRLLQMMHDIADGSDKSEAPRLAVRVQAARLLLAKALPDVSSVDINANVEGGLTITIKKIT